MARIVIALGGNALGNTLEEQKAKVGNAAKTIVDLVAQGHELVIAHGNGPQVGMINLGLSHSAADGVIKAEIPFPECGAMSQGYIGYHLQNAIARELHTQGLAKNVVTLVTQVEVDAADPSFKNPTKPIGTFYSEAEAKENTAADPTCVFKEDAGRGWRKVVASPLPVDVVEKASILHLVDAGFLVIACGGGGIPVVKQGEGSYVGVPAVIDKDYASERLAKIVDADYLYILTAVDRVCINFNKPDQKEIKEMSCREAEAYAQQGQFAPGSMLPKVKASIKFAASKAGRKAVICSLEKAALALSGKSGTIVKQ
ncbi:MAG: carbamate kinase [Firmicutes bacterium]|nr:carbamate kinase [Bacillota bacterium]